MTINFSGLSDFSASAEISAKIYTFPPRGRFAVTDQAEPSAPAANPQLPRGVKLASASAWYHDEAIKADRAGNN